MPASAIDLQSPRIGYEREKYPKRNKPHPNHDNFGVSFDIVIMIKVSAAVCA